MGLAGANFEWVAALEQFQLEWDREAILKLKRLLAFLIWSTSATADDALAAIDPLAYLDAKAFVS
jgi:hypothetical protein